MSSNRMFNCLVEVKAKSHKVLKFMTRIRINIDGAWHLQCQQVVFVAIEKMRHHFYTQATWLRQKRSSRVTRPQPFQKHIRVNMEKLHGCGNETETNLTDVRAYCKPCICKWWKSTHFHPKSLCNTWLGVRLWHFKSKYIFSFFFIFIFWNRKYETPCLEGTSMQ